MRPVRVNSGTFAGTARKKASLSAGLGVYRMEFRKYQFREGTTGTSGGTEI